MKKIFEILLAAAILANLTLPALAADENTSAGTGTSGSKTESGTSSITVNGTVKPVEGGEDKLSVVVAWEDMTFTYNAGNKGEWKPGDHDYNTGEGSNYKDAFWEEKQSKITVTNHSSIAVSAGFAFQSAEGSTIKETITGAFTKESLLIQSANYGTYQTNIGTGDDPKYDAPKGGTSFNITGGEITKKTTSLGTITVTIKKSDVIFVTGSSSDENTRLCNELQAALKNSKNEDGKRTIAVSVQDKDFTAFISGFYMAITRLGETSPEEKVGAGSIDLTIYGISSCNAFKFDTVDVSSYLSSVTLPDAIHIGKSAFEGCVNLKTVSAPNCSTVDERAFYECRYLTAVTLPEVAHINAEAFYNCWSLTNVDLPEVTDINANAFKCCSGLTAINFPKCETIGDEAFKLCEKLATAVLPEVTGVGQSAFSGCVELTGISLPKCTSIGMSAFSSCNKLATAQLPKVTVIGTSAFYNCGLTSISLPELTSVPLQAFVNCDSLKTVTLAKVTSVGKDAFAACSRLECIEFGTPVTALADTAFGDPEYQWNIDTTKVTLKFACGQKVLETDNNGSWIEGNEALTSSNVFCGKTFKEIIIMIELPGSAG